VVILSYFESLILFLLHPEDKI